MKRLVSSRKRVLRHVEAAIAEAREVEEQASSQLREAQATRKAMELARKTIASVEEGHKPVLNARRIAGPAAIEAVRATLTGVGRTTQAAIVKSTKLNSGTVSHALAVLEEEGIARKTGRRHGGSAEWATTAVFTAEDEERVAAVA